MRNKNIIFVFLFSIFIPLNFLTLISSQLPDFQEALELRTASGIPIYLTTFQLWTFNIVSLLCDSIIIAISVSIVGYYIKEMKVYLALLFGLLSRYLILIGSLLYYGGRLSSLLNEVTKRHDSGLYILISLRIQGTLMKIITLHPLVIVVEGRNSGTCGGMWISRQGNSKDGVSRLNSYISSTSPFSPLIRLSVSRSVSCTAAPKACEASVYIVNRGLAGGRGPWHQEEEGQWAKHQLQIQQDRKSR